MYVLVYRIPKTYSNGEKIRLKQGFNKTNALIMKSTFQKRLNFKILHAFMLLQWIQSTSNIWYYRRHECFLLNSMKNVFKAIYLILKAYKKTGWISQTRPLSFTNITQPTTLFARSFRRRFFAYHYAVNHPHTNIILSWFSIPLVLKCATKILKIGVQIKI